jgi:hypothetical protein
LALARLCRFQRRSIQIASVHRNAKITLQHVPSDSVSASDFQRIPHLVSPTLECPNEQTMSPLHPKMIFRGKLEPLVCH